MDWKEFQKYTAAFCAWREASGEGREGIRGVLHVIANRALKHNKTWAQVVFQYLQFSSITAPGDPQIKAGRVPVQPDAVFITCYELANSLYNGEDLDITNGATHYFADSIPMPTWAQQMTATAVIGRHKFFRED